MLCPQCNKKLKNTATTCNYCLYKFVFNKETSHISDYFFKKMLDDVGQQGSIYFTKNQLFSHYLRRQPKKNMLTALFLLVVSVILLLIPASNFNPDQIIFLNIARALFFAHAMTNLFAKEKITKVESTVFFQYLNKWKLRNKIENLLEETSLHRPPPDFDENDLFDYGVEGLIVVDDPLYVDLLVRNNYHTDLKCMVIAQNGYPEYLLKTVQKILSTDDFPRVYYLHDATTDVESMKSKLRYLVKLPENIEEIDLGLDKADSHSPIFKLRMNEIGGMKADFLTPIQLKSSMTKCLLTGIMLTEALRISNNRSNYISDFG